MLPCMGGRGLYYSETTVQTPQWRWVSAHFSQLRVGPVSSLALLVHFISTSLLHFVEYTAGAYWLHRPEKYNSQKMVIEWGVYITQVGLAHCRIEIYLLHQKFHM